MLWMYAINDNVCSVSEYVIVFGGVDGFVFVLNDDLLAAMMDL